MDFTFVVAVLALFVSLASASFEIYRWRRDHSSSKPNVELSHQFSTWSDEFPHSFSSWIANDEEGTSFRQLGLPSAFVVRATNRGGTGVEVVDIKFEVGRLLAQPEAPFEQPQDLGGFGVYKVDRLPAYVGPLRTARWWWDLGSMVHDGSLGDGKDLRDFINETTAEPRIVAVLSTGEKVTLNLPDYFATLGSTSEEE